MDQLWRGATPLVRGTTPREYLDQVQNSSLTCLIFLTPGIRRKTAPGVAHSWAQFIFVFVSVDRTRGDVGGLDLDLVPGPAAVS